MFDQEAEGDRALQPVSDRCISSAVPDVAHDTPLMGLDLSTSSNDGSTELSYCSFFGPDLQLQSIPLTRLAVNPAPGLSTTMDHSSQMTPSGKHADDQIISSSMHNTDAASFLSPESLQINGPVLHPEEGDLEGKLKLYVGQKKFTLEEILKAGLKALSHEAPSERFLSGCTPPPDGQDTPTDNPLLRTDKILLLHNMDEKHSIFLPDIRRNNFRIKQVLFTAACMANASVLGLSSEITSCDFAESPFFQASISPEVAQSACKCSFQGLKEHLRPCATQIMHAHHPYIDVLPFPTFRERVIKLAYTDSPMIDEDDLCHDLENDGLICWGSSLGGGSTAMGSGAPWDIRSWEAQPWFLKKWWILIGGVEGEIYKQTQWWCEMRGERSCYPW